MDSGFGYRNGAPETLPASQYLQERLQERRSRNSRPKRSRQTDFGPRRGRDDDIFLDEAEENRRASARTYDSSPLTASMRAGSDAGGSAYRKRQSGARDVDDQMDRLQKQNFALKLELDHRRDHTVKLQEQLDAMQEQVERAEVLADEHKELLRINTQLVEELEKRDKAVEEAMDIICDLEEKVTDMEDRRTTTNTRPSTAQADSGYAGTEINDRAPRSSPSQIGRLPGTPRIMAPPPPPASHKLQGMMSRQTPARMRREPSILSQKKASIHALRSVYMEAAQDLRPVMSFNSLLSKRDSRAEDNSPDDVLNSPRLSVLSESSFPSMYSPSPMKQLSPEQYAWENVAEDEEFAEDLSSHSRQDSIKRVSRWIEDHEVDDTPSKSNRISSPLSQQTERAASPPSMLRRSQESGFQSLNDAMSTATTAAAKTSPERLQQKAYNKPEALRRDKRPLIQLQQASPAPKSIGGPIFDDPLLPPTPTSANTQMLRASRSSVIEERSLLDTTPVAVKGFDALEPGSQTAPKQMRSSIELTGSYSNYQQRNTARGNHDDTESSSEEDDEDDARSKTIKDLSGDWDGFPDGNSIIMGTPSRFLKHGQPPPQPTLFDPNNISPEESPQSPPKRRQSSTEMTTSTRKPSLSRAETSPTFLGTIGRIVTNGSKSTVDTAVTSPRSFNSGSSSNRTIIQTEADARNRSLSPEISRTQSRVSRTSASPARTLAQRGQKLFRRMSNSHSEREGPRSPRDNSPALPTLTSTPSSAYVNHGPKEARRPSTSSDAKQSTPTTMSASQYIAQPGNRERRPSLQCRTKTAPESRAASSAEPERAGEKRNPFTRRGSAKKGSETPPPPPPQHIIHAEKEKEKEGSGSRGVTRRRGSIRDAVSGRRPWR